MKVDLSDNFWKLDINKIARYYGSKYVGDFPIPTPFPNGDNFLEYPAAVFWRPEKLRSNQLSEYFGLFKPSTDGSIHTFNASYVTKYIFNGLLSGETIVYSRFETDLRSIGEEQNAPFIDGGWTKCSVGGDMSKARKVRLQVIEGIITMLPDKPPKKS